MSAKAECASSALVQGAKKETEQPQPRHRCSLASPPPPPPPTAFISTSLLTLPPSFPPSLAPKGNKIFEPLDCLLVTLFHWMSCDFFFKIFFSLIVFIKPAFWLLPDSTSVVTQCFFFFFSQFSHVAPRSGHKWI